MWQACWHGLALGEGAPLYTHTHTRDQHEKTSLSHTFWYHFDMFQGIFMIFLLANLKLGQCNASIYTTMLNYPANAYTQVLAAGQGAGQGVCRWSVARHPASDSPAYGPPLAGPWTVTFAEITQRSNQGHHTGQTILYT